MELGIHKMTPQKLDSVVRTVTASLLAMVLIVGTFYLAVAGEGDIKSAAAEAIKAAALIVVGFYFGGHVAQNTAAIEELRQRTATAAAEDSAVRSEASAVRSERQPAD